MADLKGKHTAGKRKHISVDLRSNEGSWCVGQVTNWMMQLDVEAAGRKRSDC